MMLFFSILSANAQRIQFSKQTNLIRYVTGTMGQAKCAADMNGDGLDDITRVSEKGIFIDFQQNDGTFKHQLFPMLVQTLPRWSVCAGDLNNDGLNDLVFGGIAGVSFVFSEFYQHKFREKVMPNSITAQRSNLIDLNGDHLLDVFVCNDIGMSLPFRNDGNETMVYDISLVRTSPLPGNYSSVWTDYNNDGKTDVYISKCLPNTSPGHPARTNLLYKNLGNQQYEEVGGVAGVNDNAQSWTTVAEDFDHDGDMEFMVINHEEKNRFYRNNGNGTFTDIISQTGMTEFDPGAFEAYAGDFDNDGNPDIISDLNQPLYFGNGDLTFTGQKLPFVPGAMGDFNNDGFLDITSRSDVWINEGNKNHYVKLQLKGWESNHSGIGSKILLTSGGKTQIRELRAGQSYSPANTLDVHFGLGKDTLVDQIKIIWPSGTESVLYGLKADSTYVIPEGVCLLPSDSIQHEGTFNVCPGKVLRLNPKSTYAQYRWTTGETTRWIQTQNPGLYYVMYRDSLGCTGISEKILLQNPDDTWSSFIIVPDDQLFCKGDTVLLHSANGFVDWSNGVTNTETIQITQSGNYFFTVDSICGSGIHKSPVSEIVFTEVMEPAIKNQTIWGIDSILVELEGNDCVWFENENDDIPTYTGCRQIFPKDFEGKTCFVANRSSQQDRLYEGGKTDTIGFFTNQAEIKKMFFTIQKNIFLKSVDVFFRNLGQNKTLKVFIIQPSGDTITTIFFDLKNGKNEILLNIGLPPGNYLIFPDRPDALLNIGQLDFPYPLHTFGSIDSSSTGLNFYPYFYNWKFEVERKHCFSPRIPVLISITSVENHETDDLVVYPVPTSAGTIQMKGRQINGETRIKLYTLQGENLPVSFRCENGNCYLEWTDIPTGMYVLHVNFDGKYIQKRLVISR